ncbi:MAG: cupredoxin domain-containing protein [Anaerolineae bacterium]|nr:cupredoxin domain-containing protein [Anaerolineae bacterium]MCO5203789.1 cupredoxin domain-containing protein [Anaerolineae bacterium]
MNRQRPFTWFIFALPCILFLAGCSGKPGTLRIVSSDMRFMPDTATLQVGQPVTIELVNEDGFAHSFDLDAFNIHVPLPANTTATVTFTPEQAQQYEFYCSSIGHKKAGMIGTLEVKKSDTVAAR